MYISEEFLADVPEQQPEGRESTFRDYLNVMNPFVFHHDHQDLYGAKDDPNFMLLDHSDYLSGLSKDEFDAALGSNSEMDMYQKVDKIKAYNEHIEAMANDSLGVKVTLGLLAGATDPINFVPVAGVAAKVSNTISTATKAASILKDAAILGAVGAGSAVASEAVADAYDMPADYANASMYGFVFGAGVGGVVSSLKNARSDRAISILQDDPITKHDTAALPKEGDMPTVDANGTPARIKPFFGRYWDVFRSPVAIGYQSKVDDTRRLFAQLVNPHTSKDGQINSKSALDIKIRTNGDLNSARLDLGDDYKAAAKQGYTGTIDEFTNDVGAGFIAKANKQEIDVANDVDYKAIRSEHKTKLASLENELEKVQKALKKSPDNLELKTKGKELDARIADETASYRKQTDMVWERHRPVLNKYEQKVNTYFNTMLERSQAVDMPELTGISTNRLYFPRQIDNIKVQGANPEEALAKVKQAIATHPKNSGMDEAQLDEAANYYYNNMVDNAFTEESYTFMVSSKKFGSDSSLKGRKVYLNAEAMIDLFDTDAFEVMGKYHYWQSGQIATREAIPELQGVPIDKMMETFREVKVNPLKKQMNMAGLSNKERSLMQREIQAADDVMRDLLGSLRISGQDSSLPWVTTRLLTSANAVTMSGQMGLLNLLEVPAAMWATNTTQLFNKRFGKSLAEAHKAIFSGKYSDFQRELVLLGNLTSLIDIHNLNRMTDTQGVFNVGRVEGQANRLVNGVFKYNGLRSLQASNEAMVAANLINNITKFKPGSEMNYLNKYGLSEAQVLHIQKQLNKYGDIQDGNVLSMGLSKMDKDAADALGTAVTRAIRTGVIQGDTLNVPRWLLIPTPMRKLMFQFFRYPMAAQEQLMARGWNEDKAGLLATTIGSSMAAMGLFYLIEQAEIASGVKHPADAKYSLTTEEGQIALLTKGLSYTGTLSGLFLAKDMSESMASVAGEKLPWQEYGGKGASDILLGASASRVQNTATIIAEGIKGQFDSEASLRAYYDFFVPLGNAPIVGQGLKDLLLDQATTYGD